MTTTFGVDISNHQPGFDLGAAKRQGYDFALAKCTEGTGYADPLYEGFRRDAQAHGMLFAAYHLLHAGQAKAQADFLCAHLGDKSIPVMLDFEPMSGSNPQMADARAFIARCRTHGVRVTLNYLPGWYHQQIGSPSLKRMPAAVQSNYPSKDHAHGSELYPGDNGSGWAPYGGVTPILWQFTDNGLIDGYGGGVDLDAFRGTRDELAALGLFKDYGAKPEQPRKHPRRKSARRHRWFWFRGFWRGWRKAHPHRPVPGFVKGGGKR